MKKVIKKVLDKVGLLPVAENINKKIIFLKLKHMLPKIEDNGVVPLPKTIIFEPTMRCNLDCKMCYLSKELKKKAPQLTFDQIKKVIDKFPKTVKTVMMTGGEVFMRSDIIDIIRYLKLKGFNVHLTVNGTLITKEKVQEMKKLGNVISCGVSIDGSEKFHDSIRGVPGSYKKAVNCLKMMNSAGIITSIVCVLQDSNIENLNNLIQLAKDIGIKKVYFEYERLYPKEDINESLKAIGNQDLNSLETTSNPKRGYTKSKLIQKIKEAEKVGKELGVKVCYFPYFFRSHVKECYERNTRKNNVCGCYGLLSTRIDNLGNVVHCYALRKSFGNLFEKSFEEIWNSKEYKDLRKKLLKNNLLPVCETCLYERLIRKK